MKIGAGNELEHVVQTGFHARVNTVSPALISTRCLSGESDRNSSENRSIRVTTSSLRYIRDILYRKVNLCIP